jgi:hypothetical protein
VAVALPHIRSRKPGFIAVVSDLPTHLDTKWLAVRPFTNSYLRPRRAGGSNRMRSGKKARRVNSVSAPER